MMNHDILRLQFYRYDRTIEYQEYVSVALAKRLARKNVSEMTYFVPSWT